MKKILFAFVALFVGVFAGTGAIAACTADQIDVNSDGTNCETTKFSLTTTELAVNDVMNFYMAATGTFYVDCGDGGTLSGTGVSGKTITRTNTNENLYTCTYSTAGEKTIRMTGLATGYSSTSSYPAIRLFSGEIDRGRNSATSYGTEEYIATISGSLGAIFPTLGTKRPSFYMALRHMINIDCEIPNNLFSGVSGAGRDMMFYQLFNGSTFTGQIPDNLFGSITSAASWTFGYTFSWCTRLTGTVPANLFGSITSATQYSFYQTFNGCTGITDIADGLFSNITSITDGTSVFGGTFRNCTGITRIPESLFSGVNTAETQMFSVTFDGCTNLSGYIPPSTFAGLIENNHPSATNMWQSTFTNTNLATSCPAGTTQYTTGYESYWNGHVSCTPNTYTCAAGQYLPASTDGCIRCPARHYCPGGTYVSDQNTDQGLVACPDVSTHRRTSFPEIYYSPTITSIGFRSAAVGLSEITQCTSYVWMSNSRGALYEYATYNQNTEEYDIISTYGWADVNPGYYLTNKRKCGTYAYYSDAFECPSGSYCPGKQRVACNTNNQSVVWTTNFGLESCPTGYSSLAGSTNADDCDANTITINWNGADGVFETSSCNYDGSITTPATIPTRRGYIFTGWTFTNP